VKRKRIVKGEGSHALGIVKRFFPEVISVKDAKQPISVEVTPADNKGAKVRNHKACAMAVACKRVMKADGVIVAVTKAYIVNGKHATRFALPESVGREVVSFDRNAGFAPGLYRMNPPKPTDKLGRVSGGHQRDRKTAGKPPRFIHHTSGIRVLGAEV
jgi:hypothetical protein